jgi:hypothetical protein
VVSSAVCAALVHSYSITGTLAVRGCPGWRGPAIVTLCITMNRGAFGIFSSHLSNDGKSGT